jgi:hypothetical protein
LNYSQKCSKLQLIELKKSEISAWFLLFQLLVFFIRYFSCINCINYLNFFITL